MKIVKLKDTVRKDVPIYYRKLYTSVVVIELNDKQNDYRIDFSIETKPTGAKEINVNFIDTIDYPLVPVTNNLKTYINELDSACGLPD
jgi:2-methylaconitate cis-trans-isomerase PrpF